jgi:quinohemoprotein ethanol dehydrogenase
MAVDWRTGALRWYFQEVKHDIWNLDSPNPPTRVNVPIDGKLVPLLAVGGKNGYLYVRAARNGGPVRHFGFRTIQTYDPTGKGTALNGLPKTQLVPTGAAACIWPVDYSAAGLTRCGWPPDLLKEEYGGPNDANVRPDGSLVNVADGVPIVGTPFAAAHTSDAYFVFGGGATGGVMGYPRKAYNPITHDLYICAQGQSTGHSNMGNTPNAVTINPSYSNDPGTPQATFSAVDMTRNQMAWQVRFDATLYGNCYSGALTTAGNLAITATTGPSAQALLNTQHFPGGTSALDLSGFLLVFDATTGKLLYGWQIPIPPEASGNAGSFGSPPITYRYRGRQYIAIYHGLPAGSSYGDRLTVFSL